MANSNRARGWMRCMGAAVALMSCCAGQAVAQSDPQFDKFKEAAKKAINVRDCALVQLQVNKQLGLPMQVQVPMNGMEWNVVLRPHSVRGPNYRVIEQRADGQFYPVKAAPENTLRGEIAGQPGSIVAGGLMDDGLYAMALFPDETRYWIQPVSRLIADAPENLYAVYTTGDSITGRWRCGTPDGFNLPGQRDDQVVSPNGGTPISDRGATLFTAQLSTDADFEYFATYGGTSQVNAKIGTIVNIMNVQYERETDITHVLATQLVRAAEVDPYGSSDSGVLLNNFRDDWNNNRPGSRGDLNQLFTGKEVDGNIIGLAFVGVVCGTSAYGIVQSDFDGNLMSATDLSAHESGHNWSAGHCTCSGSGSTVSTMNPFITGINRFTFSNTTNTIGEIVGHRNSRGCLTSGGGGTDPRNDACASAVPVGPGLIGWNNSGATTDGPAACGNFGADIWYTYVAPCDGDVTVNTCGSNHDTTLAVYTGFCGSLTEVACNDDDFNAHCAGSIRTSWLNVPTIRGTTYFIRLGGFNGAVGDGLFSLSQSFCPAPSNNNCGSAITVGQGDTNFSTIGASTDGPVETTLCNNAGDAQLDNDVWYRYAAQCDGTVRVSTCNANFDSKIAIYTGCPTVPNTAIACNDDNGPACSGTRSSVDFSAIFGTTYLIRIGGFSNATGTGTMNISSLSCPTPANDLCVNAVDTSSGGVFFGTTLGATTDTTAGCGGGGNHDVWYAFTAPLTPGTLRVTTCGTHDAGGVDTGIDTVVSIYTGCPGFGIELGCNDDTTTGCAGLDSSIFRDSFVEVPLTGLQTVLVRVANFGTGNGLGGSFRLNVGYDPANDDCGSAQVISGSFSTTTNNTGSANEADALIGTCNSGGAAGIDNSIWYTFVPGSSGNLTGTIDAVNYDGLAILFQGNCGGLTEVACFDEPEPWAISTPVTSGQRYYLAIGDWGVSDGGGPTAVNLTIPGVVGGNGACCCGSFCSVSTAAACTGSGRAFAGVGTACNAPGNNTAPCCRADYNKSGAVSVQDIFDFLNGYFTNNGCADVNQSGAVSVQDIFDFLNAYFAGGC